MATQPPYANENSEDDPAPFIQLAAVTKNVMRFLAPKEKPDVEKHAEQNSDAANDHADKAKRDSVSQRVGEFVRFDQRAAGQNRC